MRNNSIIVQKHGGACLETPAKIRAVASSLAELHRPWPSCRGDRFSDG
jgi:aspartate kinase